MTTQKKPNDYVSVQKALQILLIFEPQNDEMGTMEISARTGIHKSTVSRLLTVLTFYGFLQHDTRTKKFTLGISAAKIGSAIRRTLSQRLMNIAQPYIDELHDSIGETIALEIWTGKDTVLAYYAESYRRHRAFRLQLGNRVEVHISAAARVIMAFMPPQIVESVLEGVEFPQYTTNTIVDAEQLKALLPDIRKQGWASSISERHYNADVISMPIFNYEKKPVAAVGLFTSSDRLAPLLESNVLDKLKQTAAGISTKLLFCNEED